MGNKIVMAEDFTADGEWIIFTDEKGFVFRVKSVDVFTIERINEDEPEN